MTLYILLQHGILVGKKQHNRTVSLNYGDRLCSFFCVVYRHAKRSFAI